LYYITISLLIAVKLSILRNASWSNGFCEEIHRIAALGLKLILVIETLAPTSCIVHIEALPKAQPEFRTKKYSV
jgi:hypothetical protein